MSKVALNEGSGVYTDSLLSVEEQCTEHREEKLKPKYQSLHVGTYPILIPMLVPVTL